MRTYMAKKNTFDRKWFVVDASGEILGRLAVEVARILMGKNKPTYTPNVDTGDHVIVINAEKIGLTGNKMEEKVYRHHTGWIGGIRERKLSELIKEKPDEVINLAVKRMLPKTKLGNKMFSKLHVYAGAEHKHGAQNPETISFNTKKE